MKTSREQALAEVTQLFLNFRGLQPPDRTEPWNAVDGYMTRLWEEGWTRKDILDLVSDIPTQPVIPEECDYAVSDYLTGLLGWVAYSHITRFPGEPTDVNELAAYVLGGEWRK